MSKEQMTIRLYPETRRQMDGWLEESNSKNRNEFVEKALRFYMGYLGTENITEYLSDALVATLRGIVADSANRTNSILFKCAVEQGIMAHTIAAHFRDTLGAAYLLRDDHPAQLIDAADDSGCFHLCTILPILHFPMLCSYYVEAAGKYTPARPVFAKQGRL